MAATTQRYPYYAQAPQASTFRYMDENGQMIDPETGLPVDPYAQPQQQVAPPPRATSYPTAAPPITNEQDPVKAAQQDRQWAYGRGEDLDRGFRDNASTDTNNVVGWTQAARDLYQPLEKNGGLTPQQQEQVVREQEIRDLAMTQDEIDQSGLSDVERSAVQGDPNSRRKYFNPNYENQIFDEGQGRERDTVNAYEAGLKGSYNPAALRASEGYQEKLDSGASQFGSSADEYLDPTKLNVSQDFLDDYRMTPEEEARIVEGAALTTGTRDKAAIAEAERRARGAGMNPLGVAALRARSSRAMNADAADAMTQARIGASEAAANRLKTGEGMRLQYGQNLAGMQVGAARDLADLGYRAASTGENTRLQSERDVADRAMKVADSTGAARVAQEADLNRRKLALQQNITKVGNEAERDVDDVATARARDLALNRQGTSQYVANQRYNRGNAAQTALSNRYQYAADANRADAQEARGWTRSQVDQANQNLNNTNARRLQLYGQQAGAGQEATRNAAQFEEAERNRPKAWEKILGAAVGGAGAAANLGLKFSDENVKEDVSKVGKLDNGLPVYRYRYEGSPSHEIGVMAQDVEQENPGAVHDVNGVKAVDYLEATKGGGHAAGGVITRPTSAILGENGPEMVVPLGGQPGVPAQVPPSMALRLGQPPPFATAPPRPKAAYSAQYQYGA